jgi:hypothetical protein
MSLRPEQMAHIAQLLQGVKIDGAVGHLACKHDDWCEIYLKKTCTCEPVFEIVSEKQGEANIANQSRQVRRMAERQAKKANK